MSAAAPAAAAVSPAAGVAATPTKEIVSDAGAPQGGAGDGRSTDPPPGFIGPPQIYLVAGAQLVFMTLVLLAYLAAYYLARPNPSCCNNKQTYPRVLAACAAAYA